MVICWPNWGSLAPGSLPNSPVPRQTPINGSNAVQAEFSGGPERALAVSAGMGSGGMSSMLRPAVAAARCSAAATASVPLILPVGSGLLADTFGTGTYSPAVRSALTSPAISFAVGPTWPLGTG